MSSLSQLAVIAPLLGLLGGCSPLIAIAIQMGSSPGGTLRLGQTVSGETSGAADSWHPPCGNADGGDETWIFQPERSGTYRVRVEADYDAVLAIYLAGEPVACNDDAGSTRVSELTYAFEAGRSYRLVVDGYRGAAGGYRLSLTPAPTAAPTGPLILAGTLGLEQPLQASTVGGGDQVDPSCGNATGPEAIYGFTPAASGRYTIRVDAAYDSVLAAYGADGGMLGCNDDAGSVQRSELQLDLEEGRTYSLVVAGYGGATGTFSIVVLEGASAPAPEFVDAPEDG